MSGKWTPGPWEARQEPHKAGLGWFVGQPEPGKGHAVAHIYSVSSPSHAAPNAALIAQAPALAEGAIELLAELERAFPAAMSVGAFNGVNKLRAALRLANTGKEEG